eukprot:CAMPEP_0185452898 /NCGR_PEP_ID=MMETSP1365-20130426/68481_1 /TAXON_ID=38817 /ORGANISM="Gephyrocapsa oceanica, Strain RCC1303" /LENGTH=63 /DNA_ID=CAMNT_0028059119 /DNA_START=42 /DNA_END=230 /DNA_ORIENTATION=+
MRKSRAYTFFPPTATLPVEAKAPAPPGRNDRPPAAGTFGFSRGDSSMMRAESSLVSQSSSSSP